MIIPFRGFFLLFSVGLILVFSGCVTQWEHPPESQDNADIDILSLNIHYLVPDRDGTNWDERRFAVTELIQTVDPDIILFQEMETFRGDDQPIDNIQLDWVLETVQGYTPGAIGNPEEFPITQPILYRSSRFEILKQGFFFFSDTPDQIYSSPWSTGWPAYNTWVRLLDRLTEREFTISNAHLDAFNRENRARSVELIAERMDGISGNDPIIVAGDFNMFSSDTLLKPLKEKGLTRIFMDGSSFHFGIGFNLFPAIDHFYISADWRSEDGGVIQKQWSGNWPSDHHPVFARVILQ